MKKPVRFTFNVQLPIEALAFTVLFLVLGVLSVVKASAQEQDSSALEEVLVTAQKRVQPLQEVPISVNVIDGEKIRESGFTNLNDVSDLLPNLSMNQTGIGTIISIRGISSGINQGFEQSSGMYVDDIYYGRAQLARAPYLDLEALEVLRGPQPILFGKNSIAGAINMRTARPSEDFGGYVNLGFNADEGGQDLQFAVNLPANDNLKFRVAGLSRSSDGYIENVQQGADEPDLDEQVLRLGASWDISESLNLLLKVETGEFDATGRFMEVVNPTQARVAPIGGTGSLGQPSFPSYALALATYTRGSYTLETDQNFKRQSNGDSSLNELDNVTLTINWEQPKFTLTSVTGINGYEYAEDCDCEYVGVDIFRLLSEEEYDQVSQEFRITSTGDERIDYIAGFFYQSYELKFADRLTLPPASPLITLLSGNSALGTSSTVRARLNNSGTRREFTQDSDLMAVFAQVTVNLNERWQAIFGGRYTSEDKDGSRTQIHFDNQGQDVRFDLGNAEFYSAVWSAFNAEPYPKITGTRDESAFTPQFTLRLQASEDLMFYTSFVSGYKAGGYDARSNAHPLPSVVAAGSAALVGTFEYEQEEAESVEVGLKLARDNLEFNMALFQTDYTDLQISQFDGVLGFNVTNAGAATARGLETDLRWQINESMRFDWSAAWLDFKFDRFPDAECYFDHPNPQTNDLCDLSGKTSPHAPKFSQTLSFEHIVPLGGAGLQLRWGVDANHSESYNVSFQLDPNLEQDAYVRFNARVAVESADDSWIVALALDNITDEAIMTFAGQLPTSTTLAGDGSTAYYAFYEPPFSTSLQLFYRF